MIVILWFNFRGVRRTSVQMPVLRGSRGWLFSVLEAPYAVSRVPVDLAYDSSCSIDDHYSILYRKKLHTVYPMLYKPTLKNSKNYML